MSSSPGSVLSLPGTAARPVLSTVLWWCALTGPVLAAMLVPSGFSVWAAPVVAGGIAAALVLRLILPMGALLATVALVTWSMSTGMAALWSPILMMSLCVLSYVVGRCDSGKQPLWIQLPGGLILAAALAYLLGMGPPQLVALTLYLCVGVVFPWLWGRYRHQHALLTASGWNRARELERAQRAVAEQAKLRERTRIAEDMHDSLGHELSLIAVRAAALEVDAELGTAHREAAGRLRRSAATATERLREIVGVLRADDEDVSRTTPADESLDELLARSRESGMAIESAVDGADDELPAMGERALYRVVQESLTNAAKHSPGATVRVAVTHARDYTTVTVSNPLASSDQPAGIGGGRGLLGLNERVRLAGGSLRSGADEGSFTVTARLPHSGADALDNDAGESESLRQMDVVARRARNRLVVALAAPTVMLLLLTAGTLGTYLLARYHGELSARDFAAISEGDTRREVSQRLPGFQMWDAPTRLGRTDLPSDAECEYYRSTKQGDVYELCFVDDVLIAKHTITAQERYPGQ